MNRTPEECWLLVGTYNSADDAGIHRLRFNSRTGVLQVVAPGVSTRNPSYLAWHPDGRHVYAVNEAAGPEGGRVSAFAWDVGTGTLALLNQQRSGGSAPCHLAVDDAGRAVVVANYLDGTVAVLPLREDGCLAEACQVVTHEGRGAHESRQARPHAHQVVFSPERHEVLVCDLGVDRVMRYGWNPGGREPLRADLPAWSLPPGAGPRHLVFHPDGLRAYVLGELDSTLTQFSGPGPLAKWRRFVPVSTLPPSYVGPNAAAALRLHPGGGLLCASNRGHDSVALYRLDLDSGVPVALGHFSCGGRTPRDMAFDPTGQWLLVANQDSGTVAVFRVDETGGRLIPVGHGASVPKPVCLLFAAPSELTSGGARQGVVHPAAPDRTQWS